MTFVKAVNASQAHTINWFKLWTWGWPEI